MRVSIVDAAKALGVTRQQLHNVISGRCAISPEMAYRLEKALGGTADTWLRMQANHDLDWRACGPAVFAKVRARAASIKVGRVAPKAA